jgi:hypothetical protein
MDVSRRAQSTWIISVGIFFHGFRRELQIVRV